MTHVLGHPIAGVEIGAKDSNIWGSLRLLILLLIPASDHQTAKTKTYVAACLGQ